MNDVILVVCILALIYLTILFIKNEVTFRTRIIICDAIYEYKSYCIWNDVDDVVDWDDMERYDETLFRIWDWGYTRILPADKFEIIKPFIGKEAK